MNLLPNNYTKKENGQRGEQIDIALLDMSITQMIDLYVAIDNGTDDGCVMSWVREYMTTDTPIPAKDVLDVVKNIYKEVANSHAKLVAARKQNRSQ